jgi:hypothetical protein
LREARVSHADLLRAATISVASLPRRRRIDECDKMIAKLIERIADIDAMLADPAR